MKRLLEWKQRMLQSPLTRKSSRNASRTQTPTNSSSPVPSLSNNSNNFFRQKVLLELERSGESVKSSAAQTPAESRRVSRKGSGASRSSRNRSSPRISNRPTTSSSDEGKKIYMSNEGADLCAVFCFKIHFLMQLSAQSCQKLHASHCPRHWQFQARFT